MFKKFVDKKRPEPSIPYSMYSRVVVYVYGYGYVIVENTGVEIPTYETNEMRISG